MEGQIITANTDRELLIRLDSNLSSVQKSVERIETGLESKADRSTVAAIEVRSTENEKRIGALERKVYMAIGAIAVVECGLKLLFKA